MGDGAVSSVDSSGSFVDGGKIGVEITGVGSSSRDFFSGGGDLSQGVSVGTHVGHDDQDVELSFVGKILGGGEGKSWGNNSLDGWVVGQVQK